MRYNTRLNLKYFYVLVPHFVQNFAFGEYWTGIPFGTDLTDNKTLIAFVSWLIALLALLKTKQPTPWIVAAAIVTLVIFLIPHSVFGSELKYAD